MSRACQNVPGDALTLRSSETLVTNTHAWPGEWGWHSDHVSGVRGHVSILPRGLWSCHSTASWQETQLWILWSATPGLRPSSIQRQQSPHQGNYQRKIFLVQISIQGLRILRSRHKSDQIHRNLSGSMKETGKLCKQRPEYIRNQSESKIDTVRLTKDDIVTLSGNIRISSSKIFGIHIDVDILMSSCASPFDLFVERMLLRSKHRGATSHSFNVSSPHQTQKIILGEVPKVSRAP